MKVEASPGDTGGPRFPACVIQTGELVSSCTAMHGLGGMEVGAVQEAGSSMALENR